MTPPFDLADHVHRHGAALRQLALALVGDAATADDVVQETWLGALQRPPRHDAAIGGWLATLLHNVVRGWRRQQTRRARRELAVAAARGEAAEDYANVAARGELAHRLVASLQALDAPYRETMWARF